MVDTLIATSEAGAGDVILSVASLVLAGFVFWVIFRH